MAEILVRINNAMNISNTNQALSESLGLHASAFSYEYHTILSPAIEVPDLTKQ